MAPVAMMCAALGIGVRLRVPQARALAARAGRTEVRLAAGPAAAQVRNPYGHARLDRIISHATGLSRKDVSRALRKGLVHVDGATERDGARKVALGGAVGVTFDGEPLELRPPPLLVAFHKPLGMHSTMADERGRTDLAAALVEQPPLWRDELHPVGRLDADTSGLLLFSSSGGLTQRLLHPRHGTEKEYAALVGGAPIDDGGAALRATLAAGVQTTEGTHAAALLDVVVLDNDGARAAAEETARAAESAGLRRDDGAPPIQPVATLRLSVTEGKHRMVRRLLANAGHPVLALHRVRFGDVVLDPDELPPGASAVVGGDALAWAERLAEIGAAQG
ncbi:hypothetical protein KFE25_004961 [Diacronema lutheri]|uniref:Pseudouridine synthase RsuA/RluA-like domain-containing protein n=1 Tax=Diacronema lutheri TaxID=2081491 RepID=A0A8J5XQ74_DIALT|nr:hypothetical protein KFE25_004961 [Diacronema lutheri]